MKDQTRWYPLVEIDKAERRLNRRCVISPSPLKNDDNRVLLRLNSWKEIMIQKGRSNQPPKSRTSLFLTPTFHLLNEEVVAESLG